MLKERSRFSLNVESFREIGLLFFIIIIVVIIQFRNPTFLTLDNINTLLVNAYLSNQPHGRKER